MGHIRDLPKSQLGVDIENRFKPKYITIRGRGEILKDLKKARKKAKEIFLAVDPDREGEAIAWHLANVLDIDLKLNCRVVFNEITKDAIKESFKFPRPIDMNLVNAQQARRILDRLVGYGISPLLWKKVKKGLSAGRVQSIAVKFIVDREKQIRSFVPEEYWTITSYLRLEKTTFKAFFYGFDLKKKVELKTKEEVEEVIKDIQDKEFIVEDIKESQRKRSPVLPFTTSTLQQEAAKRLNFRSKKTMLIAQQLYEGISIGKSGFTGLITYMRTDSTRVSETAKNEAKEYILEKFGQEYIGNYSYAKKGKIQDAHEAIRPTSIFRLPEDIKEYLSTDQYKLYKLIWERFLASQMKEAILDNIAVMLKVSGENKAVYFKATGSKIRFPGFMKVYTESIESNKPNESEEVFLPTLSLKQPIPCEKIEPKQHFTQPPPRYNEAKLVKLLEEKGIGRPSTYAPTLDIIQKRGYVLLEDKKFVPSELGELVLNLIEEFFPEILNVEFTASMEEELDLIGEGKVDWVNILDKFYKSFSLRLQHAEKVMEKVELKLEYANENCEKCGSPMVYRYGRFGKFLACASFPACKNSKPIVKGTGVICPKCKKGEVVERKSKKKRTFYGCKDYPKCDFISWHKLSSRPCPKCKEVMVEKKKKKEKIVKCLFCEFSQVCDE